MSRLGKTFNVNTCQEASNAFFTSSNIPFTEKKTTLEARYRVPWSKK